MQKPVLIAICGPTASGKTALSIELAKYLQTEIISFDSRQFYTELKIGAAPPNQEELQAAPHHFIQHLSVSQDYNAGQYERDAISKLEELFKKQRTLVAVGGSGMYLKAIEEGFDDLPDNVASIREELNLLFKNEGIEPLQQELKEKDPAYWEIVDQQNHVRLIRALEVIRSSGKTYSELRNKPKKERPFQVVKIGIDYPREELYQRINLRVDLMMKAGLLKEAEALYPQRAHNALHTVGYTEFFNFIDGKWDLDFAISEVKKNSRRYAKRQMTWFRKDPEINWIDPGDFDAVKKIIAPYI